MATTYGKNIKITIFGESHCETIGVVIDGIPGGITLSLDAIREEISRRAPQKNISTTRIEKDLFKIVSGYFNELTTGAPLTFLINNENIKSSDYEAIRYTPRPSHADYSAFIKYHGANDYRGGGYFSGRLTVLLAICGAVCKQLLKNYNIEIFSRIRNIKDIYDEGEVKQNAISKFGMISSEQEAKAIKCIEEHAKCCDSVGGVVECFATSMIPGLGSPFFDSLESQISHLLFSIPAVKGVEFGDGFAISNMKGSIANDSLHYQNQNVTMNSNHNGGINGGISNGMDLKVSVAFKPTPSIAITQDTVNLQTKENTKINIQGRHDPCIVPRARVLVEDAVAIVLLDELMSKVGSDGMC